MLSVPVSVVGPGGGCRSRWMMSVAEAVVGPLVVRILQLTDMMILIYKHSIIQYDIKYFHITLCYNII